MDVRSRSRWRRAWTFSVPLGLFALVTLFPFYWMFVTSVRPDEELYSVDVSPFYTLHPTLAHFRFLFHESFFGHWLWNTLFVAVLSTVISLFCGILAGYALARLRFRGASTMGIGIFITYLVPPTLLFLPLSQVVVWLGISDTIWALIVTYPTFLVPFSTWLLMGYFRTIPREVEVCALVDGASRMQTLTRIVLPMAIPGLVCVTLFGFTLTWNEFTYALTFVSQSANKTAVVGVTADLIRGDIYYWGSLMAGAVVASLPIVVIYVWFLDYYVSGLTAGAVKG
jgi:multiple sugar transport system permease protein